MNEADMSTTTHLAEAPMVAERWTSAIHAAAADLAPAAAEHVGISIGGLRITANEWSATLSVAPRLEARVYPGSAHEDVRYDTTLGLEQLSALHAVLGGILRRMDAAEAA
jgi:hypothetical protein